MPDLTFEARDARAVPFCMSPTLGLVLRVTDADGGAIEAVALDCQVRIDAQRRRYSAAEKERLVEMFGPPERWAQTLRSLLWTHASVSVPPFRDETEVELQVPCTADFNELAGKFFAGLDENAQAVPVSLLFSGSIFYRDEQGLLQVTRVPWSAEATYDLPVAAWREVVTTYYPNTAWLTLRQDVFDRLYAFRTRHGLPSWEAALERLLAEAQEEARP
ncbi:MAG TPA: DUF6084 family protein [Candidatus Dormibacteraeota bacterium]|jgi:hypothetical protein|nr:DUF6084 family protein [Candidatus Dormibacteraeota bacterium]